jgi:hypothetical protein
MAMTFTGRHDGKGSCTREEKISNHCRSGAEMAGLETSKAHLLCADFWQPV